MSSDAGASLLRSRPRRYRPMMSSAGYRRAGSVCTVRFQPLTSITSIAPSSMHYGSSPTCSRAGTSRTCVPTGRYGVGSMISQSASILATGHIGRSLRLNGSCTACRPSMSAIHLWSRERWASMSAASASIQTRSPIKRAYGRALSLRAIGAAASR